MKGLVNMKGTCLAVVSFIASATAAFGFGGEWISVPDAPVYIGPVKDNSRAADGTSWFARKFTNAAEVASAKWTVSGLGVFEVFVNGAHVGDDFLKPGFTHFKKTKYSFSYDVTDLLKRGAGEENVLAAEVSAGWWRDKILTPAHNSGERGFLGNKSAFRGELEIKYADGRVALVATDTESWRCGVAGSVTHAAIYDGEEYDARIKDPVLGEGLVKKPEINTEFAGEVLPSCGAEVTLRRDLAMVRGPFALKKGDTLIVDFEQNCAAVPEFRFSAKRGTVLTALPAEMLNDADKGERGCDGPKGSVYRENLRCPDSGMRVVYTFAGDGVEKYIPRFTFFGFRYISITATDDVNIESIASVPVTSIKKEMELGKIETGDKDLNRFIQNVYWGQLSNYLSVPTDCPQRNERLGWMEDTQVFCEAGSFNADTRRFFRKFARDMRDSQDEEGGYPSVAPFSQYGNETFSLGWADAGVIVPWTVWRQFGDESIVRENWDAMSKFVRKLDETKYDFEGKLGLIYADWLSYEKFETCGNKYGSWEKWKDDPDAQNYRRFLAACYWLYDARLMAEMGEAIGKNEDVAWFRASADRALAYIREKFVEEDGLLLTPMRDLQTACVFALKFGVVKGAAREATKELLLKSIREHGDCLQTGFLGIGFIMDALTECGAADVAYTLLLQHKNPSWLYSVDQGATTVWERWNSYTKATGFGPVSMNSFNHYAFGSVLAWIYRMVAGIAADSSAPGFKRIVMAPKPSRRLGYVKAEYKSAAGLVKSAWRYEGDDWVWEFTVPEGASARVLLPDETAAREYQAGSYTIRRRAAADSLGYASDTEKVSESKDFGTPPPADAPYRDASLDIEKRIDDLLPRLMDEEKAHIIHFTTPMTAGHIPRIGLATFRTPDAGGGVRAVDRPGITYFPSPIAYAASFDKSLAKEIGRAMGAEARATFPPGLDSNGTARMLLGPGANIARTPLGGRNFEYLGEDPRLAGEIAAAWIAGLQSVKVSSCMKHYCFNDQESDRTIINVECPERAAREIYVRPFEIAVRKADPWAFMSSYNKYRGKWTSHNAELNDVLLKECGSTGAIIPDWGGVHGMPDAINGGTSLESDTRENAGRDKDELKLLAEGKIDRARFDDSVRRALRLYFRVGAFDEGSAADRGLQAECVKSFRSEEHQSLARRAAEESFVLLKNDGILPFAGKTVAVIGPYADIRHAMSDGDTKMRAHGGSGAIKAAREVTPLEGFRTVFGQGNVFTGPDAAAKADLVVYCGGTDHQYDREFIGWGHLVPGDKPDIFMCRRGEKTQEDEILEVAKVNPNLVVVLNGGAPIWVEKWHESAKAVFAVWYGGEFGGEVLAEMVKGAVNPSGRLPYTYGKKLDDWHSIKLGERSYPGVWPSPPVKNGNLLLGDPQVEYLDGIWVGYRGFDKFGIEPRYPFGHGLSYTTWETALVDCNRRQSRAFDCKVRVVNTGAMAGRRSVLLFASKPQQPDAEMPKKELVAFESVWLGPGESSTIEFNVGFEELKYWSERKNCWRMPEGDVSFTAE